MDRQWAQSPDLLLVNLEEQTDSFTLYIKGTILICECYMFRIYPLNVLANTTLQRMLRHSTFASDPNILPVTLLLQVYTMSMKPFKVQRTPSIPEVPPLLLNWIISSLLSVHLSQPICATQSPTMSWIITSTQLA